MPNIWILMRNEEHEVVDLEHNRTLIISQAIRAYQQHATAEAMMKKANLNVREQETADNFIYYSIEEVAYV